MTNLGSPLHRWRAARAGLVGALLLAAGLGAQLRPDPDAPVRDFRLPMFGDDGLRAWELRGDVGRFRRDRTLLVEGLDLKVFAPGGEVVESRIRSPEAVLDPETSQASGDSPLLVETADFELRGEDWSWDGQAHRIIVRRQVHTVFYEELTGLLK